MCVPFIGQAMNPVEFGQNDLASMAALDWVRNALQGSTDLRTKLRRRYGDYASIIEPFQSKPGLIAAKGIERELRRLTELFTRVAGLIGAYIGSPVDSKMMKIHTTIQRAAAWKDVEKELNEIDVAVMRQLTFMKLKGALISSETKVLQRADDKVNRVTSSVVNMRPSIVPDIGFSTAGARAVSLNYWSRLPPKKLWATSLTQRISFISASPLAPL